MTQHAQGRRDAAVTVLQRMARRNKRTVPDWVWDSLVLGEGKSTAGQDASGKSLLPANSQLSDGTGAGSEQDGCEGKGSEGKEEEEGEARALLCPPQHEDSAILLTEEPGKKEPTSAGPTAGAANNSSGGAWEVLKSSRLARNYCIVLSLSLSSLVLCYYGANFATGSFSGGWNTAGNTPFLLLWL